MVQVGATVSYHDPMDEKPEPSWANTIRSAVRQFVDAVNESSKQLASASEHFAVQSLQAMDEVRARSEQSAEASAQMAQQAKQSAEEARGATYGLQAAVDEAKEMVRNEARQTFEQVAGEAARINEIGAQVKQDLQQRIDEMVARLEAGTAGHQEALETAQAATTAAQAAADRIENSVNAIEAAVAAARRAAEEARAAAEQSIQNVGSVTMAVTSAQEAAESSRQSASLAEQAGQRSDFAAEASMLLERLETDYSLLTRLVQELHSRISSLSSINVAPPQPTYEPVAEPAPLFSEPPIEAYGEEPAETEAWQEPVYEAYEPAVPVAEEPAHESFEVAAPATAEQEPAFESFEQLTTTGSETQPEDGYPAWARNLSGSVEQPGGASEATESVPEPLQGSQEPSAFEQESAASAPQETAAVTPSITIFGRVQMTISPVPDFDKLLSLDSALARVAGVHSVTLADYAREEVIFRVELEKPVSVAEFARQLSETAGVSTDVTEASESTVSIRIG